MLVTLGFLLAALLLVVFLPAYRRRIERFSAESVKRHLPLTESEIRADKDRLRAEYAMDVHRLEMKLDEASHAAARQSIEVNRRDAKIQDLTDAISAHKLTVEEHENARRVLEQAILDRLPKVEQRLSDTRKLLAARDKEIIQLTESSAKQSMALEEATQVNRQQADEVYRLKAALDTRAARNRDAVGDPRFDGEVALRTEIEMLRAQTRDQASVIERLQSSAGAEGSDVDRQSEEQGREIARLKVELARVEAALDTARGADTDVQSVTSAFEARIRESESREQDHAAEVVKLKAALRAYETGAAADIADKAEISALRAEVEAQQELIQSLRSEIAASGERQSRQAQHFREELRRLGTVAVDNDDEEPAAAGPPRLSLAERIAVPKVAPRATDADARPGAFLKAVNGGVDVAEKEIAATDGTEEGQSTAVAPRRPRLLDRISRIEKKV